MNFNAVFLFFLDETFTVFYESLQNNIADRKGLSTLCAKLYSMNSIITSGLAIERLQWLHFLQCISIPNIYIYYILCSPFIIRNWHFKSAERCMKKKGFSLRIYLPFKMCTKIYFFNFKILYDFWFSIVSPLQTVLAALSTLFWK